MNSTFDSEHLQLKNNNGTKRIKISENEEYLQISKTSLSLYRILQLLS